MIGVYRVNGIEIYSVAVDDVSGVMDVILIVMIVGISAIIFIVVCMALCKWGLPTRNKVSILFACVVP